MGQETDAVVIPKLTGSQEVVSGSRKQDEPASVVKIKTYIETVELLPLRELGQPFLPVDGKNNPNPGGDWRGPRPAFQSSTSTRTVFPSHGPSIKGVRAMLEPDVWENFTAKKPMQLGEPLPRQAERPLMHEIGVSTVVLRDEGDDEVGKRVKARNE